MSINIQSLGAGVAGLAGIAGGTPTPRAGETPAPRATEQAAHDFESVLLQKVLEEMQRTVPKSGLLDDSMSEQIQGLFTYHMAQDLANKGGLGLWKQIQRQMQATTPAARVEVAK
jgi:flagellar protein FlgJ